MFSFFSHFDKSGVWGVARRGSESIPHTEATIRGQPGQWDESLRSVNTGGKCGHDSLHRSCGVECGMRDDMRRICLILI